MKKKNAEFLFPLVALIILILVLSQQMFDVPPLGKLMDPFIGVVQNERDNDKNETPVFIDKMGLTDSVSIFFDNRNVPHIYAKNNDDLYFVQGYITAYFRLWEMDFLSYVSAGRLSEIFRDGYLDYDRKQRRMGILDAARASLALIEKDTETSKMLTAYSKGVNAYIKQLNYKTIPLEYKLLNYEPEPWSDLKTVLIMKHMASILSGYEEDYIMTNMIIALGEKDYNKYFPSFDARSTAGISDSATSSTSYLSYTKKPPYIDYSFLAANPVVSQNSYNPTLGSNSWVVSGKKTKSGFPILCADPHLSLSLPAIWIEMQLTAPGINVYGVSIPGTPSVTIGFNENIAWGMTNGTDDARDWYKLKLSPDYKKYEFDGKWLDLNFTIEAIKRKGQKTFYDTIYHTVHGPIVCDARFPGSQPEVINHALRWELQKPSNEFLTFSKLNRAASYTDYKNALKHFSTPAQNFTFACKDNDIAMNHQGRMPVKWPGQGKFILDGTTSDHLYTKYVPEDSLPYQFNPLSDYIVSANQQPTGDNYPYYYNGYYRENRSNRIKTILDKTDQFDIQKMQVIQLDNTSVFGQEALPLLIKCIDSSKLTADERKMLETLRAWKGTYDFNDKNAELFELWWKNIKKYTWDEFSSYSFGSKIPDDYILLDIIQKEPANNYFDKQGTTPKENAGDIIHRSFSEAVVSYYKMEKEGNKEWSDFNKVNVMHMMNIGQFSKTNLPSGGYPEAINAIAGNTGPSWRMIVELGARPTAFGIYPGGQSGNVGSSSFDNFISDWNKGAYYPLFLFISEKEAGEHTIKRWKLK